MSTPDDPNRILCYCLGVPYGVVEAAIREQDLKTVAAITQATKAGAGCRSCHPELKELLTAVRQGEGKARPGFFGRLFGRGGPRDD